MDAMSQPENGAFGTVEACGQSTSVDSSIICGLEEPVWKVEEEERGLWFPAAEEQGSPARHSKNTKGHPKKNLPKKQTKAARTLPHQSSSLSKYPHSVQSSAKDVDAHTEDKKKSLETRLKLLQESPDVQSVCSRWWKLLGCQDAMGVKEFTTSYVSVLWPLVGDQHGVEVLEKFAIEDWEEFLQQSPKHVVCSDSGRQLAYSGFFLFFCHELFTLALAVLGAEADDSSVSDFIELTVLQGQALSGSSLRLEFSEDGPKQPAALPEAEQEGCASVESTESELAVQRSSAAHLPAFAGGGTAQETATPGALSASNGECRTDWANKGDEPADERGADETQGGTAFLEGPQARGSSTMAVVPRKSSLRTEPVPVEKPNFKQTVKVKWDLENLSHPVIQEFTEELEERDSEPILHSKGTRSLAIRNHPSPEPLEPSSEFTIFSKLLTTEEALPIFTSDDARKFSVNQKAASLADPRMRRKRVASAMYEALFSQKRFLRFQRSSAEEIKEQVQRRRKSKQEAKMARAENTQRSTAVRPSGHGAATGSPAKHSSPAMAKGKPVPKQGEEPSPCPGHGHDPKSGPQNASPTKPGVSKGASAAGSSVATGAVAHNPPARTTPTASASRTPPNKLLGNGVAAAPLGPRQSDPKELTTPITRKVLPKTASPPRSHGEGSSHSLHTFSSHREYSAASLSAGKLHHTRSPPPLKTWHSAGNLKPYAHEAAKMFFEREAQKVLPGKRGLSWKKGSSFWQRHPPQWPGCRPTTMTPTMPSGWGTGPSLFSTNFSHHTPGVHDPSSPLSPPQGKARRSRPTKEPTVEGEEAELADTNEEPLQQVRSEPNFWSSSEWRGPRNKVISELMRQTYASQKPTFWHALNDPAPAYMHYTVNYHYKEPLPQTNNLVTTPPIPLDENTDGPETLWKPDEHPSPSPFVQMQSMAMQNEGQLYAMKSMYAAQLSAMKKSMLKKHLDRSTSRMFTPAMNAEEEMEEIAKLKEIEGIDDMMEQSTKRRGLVGAYGAESPSLGMIQRPNMTRRSTLKGSLMPPHPVANTAYGDEIYAVDCVIAERVGRKGAAEYLVKYTGHGSEQNGWLEKQCIDNVDDLLRKFHLRESERLAASASVDVSDSHFLDCHLAHRMGSYT